MIKDTKNCMRVIMWFQTVVLSLVWFTKLVCQLRPLSNIRRDLRWVAYTGEGCICQDHRNDPVLAGKFMPYCIPGKKYSVLLFAGAQVYWQMILILYYFTLDSSWCKSQCYCLLVHFPAYPVLFWNTDDDTENDLVYVMGSRMTVHASFRPITRSCFGTEMRLGYA